MFNVIFLTSCSNDSPLGVFFKEEECYCQLFYLISSFKKFNIKPETFLLLLIDYLLEFVFNYEFFVLLLVLLVLLPWLGGLESNLYGISTLLNINYSFSKSN